jgi:hypothetical protein
MSIEPWQVPVIVMAALAVPVWIYYTIRGDKPTAPAVPPHGTASSGWRVAVRKYRRSLALGALTLLLVVIAGWALGPSTSDKLTTGASVVSALVAVSLTLQSIASHKSEPREEGDPPTESAKPAGHAATE